MAGQSFAEWNQNSKTPGGTSAVLPTKENIPTAQVKSTGPQSFSAWSNSNTVNTSLPTVTSLPNPEDVTAPGSEAFGILGDTIDLGVTSAIDMTRRTASQIAGVFPLLEKFRIGNKTELRDLNAGIYKQLGVSDEKNPFKKEPVLEKVIGFDPHALLAEKAKNVKDFLDTQASKPLEDRMSENPLNDTFVGQTAKAIGGMVPQLALAAVRTPTLLLSLSESAMNVEDSYKTNIKNGMSEGDAMKRAVPQLGADLLGTYLTEKFGKLGSLEKALEGQVNGTLTKTIFGYLKDSGLEVAQEVYQQALQNLAEDKPITENLSETAKLTIIPAMLFGLAGPLAGISNEKIDEAKTPEQKQAIIDEVKAKIESNHELVNDPEIRNIIYPEQAIPTAPTPEQAMANAGEKVLEQSEPASVTNSSGYTTVYHGGEKIEKIDLGKSNFGKTFFVTDSPEYAAQYASKYKENGTVNNIEIKNSAKLIDIKNAPKDVIDKIKKIATGEATGKNIKIQKPDGTFVTIPEYKNIPESGFGNYSMKDAIDGAIRGKSHLAEAPGLVQIYKDLGYDGMITYEDSGMRGKNIGVWNENIIRTKQSIPKAELPTDIEQGTSKIAKSVEAKAIEAGLTKGFSDLAGYDKITIKDQAARADAFIKGDINEVRAVLKGEKELPHGLKGTALIKGVEDFLKENPNPEIAYELANSKLISGTSEAAQELRLAAERDPDSVTAKLQEIKNARESKLSETKRKRIQSDVKKITEETQKVNLSKEDLRWDNFLDSISC